MSLGSGFLLELLQYSDYKFKLYGYARSGQHAISHWLLSHAPQTSVWVNNMQGKGENVDYKHYWYGPMAENHYHLLGIGFEGYMMNAVKTFPEIPLILVVRDIYNQTASIQKHPNLDVDTRFFNSWLANAKQALDISQVTNRPFITVKFNSWFISVEYRKQIFEQIREIIGFPYPFTDTNYTTVLGVGGGSSFDRMAHQFDANKMKVLERYKEPEIQNALKVIPAELRELNDHLFPEFKGTWEID